LGSNLSTLRDLRIVYYALLANNIFHSFFMAFQVATGLNYNMHGEYSAHYLEREGFRPAAFTGSWDSASSMIDIILPVVLTHFLIEEKVLKRIGLAICMGILLGGLLLTRVRASLAALILFSFTVLIVCVKRQWINWRRMTAVVLTGFALLLATTPLMLKRFETGYYGEDRMPLIYTALNMAKHNPLFGVGANNYSYRIPDYLPAEQTGSWVYIVHNEFLLRLAETGIIGFLLFYSLVVWVMVKLWRLTRSQEPWIFIWSCGLFAAFMGSIPHRMLTAYHFDSMFYMFCLSIALTCAMVRYQYSQRAGKRSPD
jgi:O-antigen ligase